MASRIINSIALLIFTLIVGLIQPAHAQTPLEQSATTFTNLFWSNWSDPNEMALPYIQTAVDDPVIFFGKSTPLAAYTKTQTAFAQRWPMRSYNSDSSLQTVHCDDATLSCTVNGVVTWRDFSPSRKVSSTGTANYGFQLREHKDVKGNLTGLLIEAISGSVISQKLLHVPPVSAIVTAPVGGNFASPPQPPNDTSQNSIVSDAALQNVGCTANDRETLDHQDCVSLAEKDVTAAFHQGKRTIFEILQATDNVSSDGLPPMDYCFFQKDKAQCRYETFGGGGGANHVFDLSLVYPRPGAEYPLLLAHLSWCCRFGCGGLFNYVWAYNPGADTFNLIWSRPYDCHTALRFMTKGPLTGDMIAVDSDVTDRWPWPYGIEVYKLVPPDKLEKILYFVGRAGQGGKYVTGPDNAIDVDMPETLRRLGLSK